MNILKTSVWWPDKYIRIEHQTKSANYSKHNLNSKLKWRLHVESSPLEIQDCTSGISHILPSCRPIKIYKTRINV
ncbi:MAG: hypothetical protein GY679_04200 [Mycoplasma sp.]|nr:hypothetical protein [Mycoplasma sp.]